LKGFSGLDVGFALLLLLLGLALCVSVVAHSLRVDAERASEFRKELEVFVNEGLDIRFGGGVGIAALSAAIAAGIQRF
jgi:hypothetical protein